MLRAILCLAGWLALANPAIGQPSPLIVTVNPTQPFPTTPVQLYVRTEMTWCTFAPRIGIEAYTVAVHFDLPNCAPGQIPPPAFPRPVSIELGSFDQTGDYQVELYLDEGQTEPTRTVQFTVRPPPPDPTLAFWPARPSGQEPVTARITAWMTWCEFDPLVTTEPGRVRIDLRLPNCGGGVSPRPPALHTVEVPLGVLAPGQYLVDLVMHQSVPETVLTVPLTVTATAVPVRSPWALAGLLLALLVTARRVLRVCPR